MKSFTNAGTCAKDFDLNAAEGYLRRALGMRPDYPEALYQMADVSYRQDKFLQARAFIERRLGAADPRPETLWLGQSHRDRARRRHCRGRLSPAASPRFPGIPAGTATRR